MRPRFPHDPYRQRRKQGRLVASELGSDFLRLDVGDEDSFELCSRSVEDIYGRLDVLMNNAAITGGVASSTCLAKEARYRR